MTFWEHLDELRGRLWRMLIAAVAAAAVCFCFKDVLFHVVLAPKPAGMHLINTDLTQQFLIHLRVAFWGGALAVSPYIIYQMFAFVAPGLYAVERQMALRAVGGGYLLFIGGVLLNYFVVFPITLRFLGDYQVTPEVANHITITSYINIMLMMCLLLGLVFELPVLCWLLAKIGVLKAAFMRRYRRHAIVAIVIIAAVITPTGDPFTLALVSVPIYLLWELSIIIVKHTEKK